MIYRIRIDMMFCCQDPMEDILEECKRHEAEAVTINPGDPDEVHSSIDAQECYHDEHPGLPCPIIYEWQSP